MKNITYYLLLPLLLLGWQVKAQVGPQGAQGTEGNDIPIMEINYEPEEGAVIIDGRPELMFKYSHLPGSINIMEEKFGDFLPQIIDPDTEFYLVADEPERLTTLVEQAEAVGYAPNIKGVFLYNKSDGEKMDEFRHDLYIRKPKSFTIVDIRTREEHAADPVFKKSINIPLTELEDRAGEIPTKKPIIIHCATGYRSAIGSSILNNHIKNQKVLDMGTHIKDFKKDSK